MSSNSKHTPGPWRIERGTRSWTRPGIRAAGVVNGTPQGPEIARMIDAVGAEQTGANASLIAAAPDLLAACKALLSFARSVRPGGGVLVGEAAMLRGADAAIARAEGGPT